MHNRGDICYQWNTNVIQVVGKNQANISEQQSQYIIQIYPMAEAKTPAEKTEVDVDFIYTVEDEIFPLVRTEVLKGVTKDKGPTPVYGPAKPTKYRHKPGFECLICKKHQTPIKEPDASSSQQIHDKIQMLLHEEDILDGPPPNSAIVTKSVNKFNRELLKTTCQIMGCKPIHGHLIAEDMFEELNTFLTAHSGFSGKVSTKVCMKKSTFHQILKQILFKYEYAKPQCIGDFQNATELVDHRCNLIILLGGSSGTGKSTLASLIASRLGISTVLSTDSIRHIMRNFVSREENPILFCSTYETGKFVPEDPENPVPEKKRLLTGFQTQCQYVHPHLMKVIDDLIIQNDNVVIEGVHLTVDFLMSVMKKYPFCIPFVVYIKNKEKHKERFAVRSKQMTLDPRYNKYVECFENIRIIHKFFVRKAEKSLIPRIDNTNVDKSLGLIHSTIVRCLRKVVKGETLVDESTNKATMLCQEFNAVSKSGLSSAEAQKVIKSKVNKGEIFKRFFGVQEEAPLVDSLAETPMDDEGGMKRVHSFDENEMEQLRKENEAQIKEHEKDLLAPEEGHKFDPLRRLTGENKKEEGDFYLQGAKLEALEPLARSPKPNAPAKNLLEADLILPPTQTQMQQAEEEDIKKAEKPMKTSKSSENLLEEAKKKKKVKFARNVVVKKFRKDDLDSGTGDEDKQSFVSGLCSVYSGSIDVNTHGTSFNSRQPQQQQKLKILAHVRQQSLKDQTRTKRMQTAQAEKRLLSKALQKQKLQVWRNSRGGLRRVIRP
eukprot:TRINITY_DN2046_c0_g1_i1.p1 TRINITY_DN2046_c0_g1~~TRINITY_DN2046_c0_g1_i1.p1  ORF type:complete len:772 (-),score=81.10 TRINITY_DN2046_c0_g1_i1:11611-13926(-)